MQKASNFQLPRHASDFEEDYDRWPWSNTSSYVHAFLSLGCKLATFPVLSPSALQMCISPWFHQTHPVLQGGRDACMSSYSWHVPPVMLLPGPFIPVRAISQHPLPYTPWPEAEGNYPIQFVSFSKRQTSKPYDLWREEILWFHWRECHPMWESFWADHHHPFWSCCWTGRRLPCSSLWPFHCVAQTVAEIQDSWPPLILCKSHSHFATSSLLLFVLLNWLDGSSVYGFSQGSILATLKELGYSSKSSPFSCPYLCHRQEPHHGSPNLSHLGDFWKAPWQSLWGTLSSV